MIHVIASIRVKTGKLHEFLDIFKSNVPNVQAESGCIDYIPTVDVETGLPPQILDENVVTIIEKWETRQVLFDHMAAPHMIAYKERVKDLVENVSLKILNDA
jgi:quinol monooxygenase YgiN